MLSVTSEPTSSKPNYFTTKPYSPMWTLPTYMDMKRKIYILPFHVHLINILHEHEKIQFGHYLLTTIWEHKRKKIRIEETEGGILVSSELAKGKVTTLVFDGLFVLCCACHGTFIFISSLFWGFFLPLLDIVTECNQ